MALLAGLVGFGPVGCFAPGYIEQAAQGQADLRKRSRPIKEVIADPDVPERTRMLLGEVGRIKRFAAAHGLTLSNNYRDYVEFDREAVVWIVSAVKPLSFEAKAWSFPVVGSFPMIGWFDIRDAVKFRDRLRAKGWDVHLRGARAFSTGGWFTDPIVSTMFGRGDEAMGSLVNVVIHELTHVTILVSHQSTFNESVANFIGDEMTLDYLRLRFGKASVELVAYEKDLAEERTRVGFLLAAYATLETLYASGGSDKVKRTKKKKVFAKLAAQMRFRTPPNNATLMGVRTYNVGRTELGRLLTRCGRDWRRFRKALGRVKGSMFKERQQKTFGRIIDAVTRAGC